MSSNKVLLVDDEELTAKYFKKIMQNKGIEVDYYTSLDELREHYPELSNYKTVFVDLKLDKNGWHAHGKDILREMINISDLPFYVVWTAFGDCPEATECLEMGASLVVRKDGDMEKLFALVNHIDKAYIP